MSGPKCRQTGCSGAIEDGYCNVCGHAAAARKQEPVSTRSSGISTGTGSTPVIGRSARGSRRSSSHSTSRSSRKQLGAGVISVPELPSTDPEKAIMAEARVPDHKRYCPNCDNPLGREKGFCGKCGQKYSFAASLQPGDLVASQYEVKGAIAYGGLGWIYLAFDRVLSRYVVLKGLLNVQDESSAATAVAERQFLAAVKHPNIVGIYNFVQHGAEGFIVMEYVGGKSLKEIRKERGPLPVTESIAYVHRILGAFAYLHSLGMVYCDFKPDNMMLEENDVKLIDLGGVRRIGDPKGDIYGTTGYSAPEAGEGPTVSSDLFTIGRTLAVLLADIRGFSGDHRYTLPSVQEEPLFAREESLYRFLLKATAHDPDDRFQSADQMADQLIGVLREAAARATGTPRTGVSSLFSGDVLAMAPSPGLDPVRADYHQLPVPILDSADPAFHVIVNASGLSSTTQRVDVLRKVMQQFAKSVEARLQLANALIESRAFDEAETLLKEVEAGDPWDWRVLWYRGRSFLAQGKAKEAQAAFDQVYFDLPGELAPKLALGLAAELSGNHALAIQMFDTVSRTDPAYASAAFGLARCLAATGDRKGAVAGLGRIPAASSLYTRARVESARALIGANHSSPGPDELKSASDAIEALSLEGLDRYRLAKQMLGTALELVTSKAIVPAPDVKVLGTPLQENKLRAGLERALRGMAHLSSGHEKILLVDEANRVRPRTLF